MPTLTAPEVLAPMLACPEEPYGSEHNASQAKAVRELGKENARLKKLVAEKELTINILTEVARGKF